ncbi:Site-specific recombinase XerD [Roseospirillum parvum]|uniref:Site-specific recombinase XerD n=2 Tax=Roseospirillum parvum TaxID=83401 RepID=A0A1G8EI50_9PROT|nr:site-specific integrase [Roseospirillum parvum]SDH69556.1 Site-specific recombinase XerD [Roseospirillum parvum]
MRRARLLSITADRLFDHLMSHPELTPDQIDDLARKWFAEALRDEEDFRLSAQSGKALYVWPRAGEDPVDADLELLSELEADYREAIACNQFSKVARDVECLLGEAGRSAEPGSDVYKRLCLALLRANIELFRISKARRVGDYSLEPIDPLFRRQSASVSSMMPEPGDQRAKSLPLGDVLEAYEVAQVRDGKWQPTTRRNAIGKLRLFVETLDGKPIDTVTRDDIRGWREVLEEGERSNNTIRHHFKVVAALFNWAKQEGKATIDNPTVGLMPPADAPKRDAFSADELRRLFHSPLYTGHWRADRRERPGSVLVKDYKYWFPLISLHTGMRVEEIAKLRVADVRMEDGVWCFDILKSKTKAGERLVPIHPRLIDLGFLEHVKAIKHERLWPELKPNSEGSHSHRFAVWFPGYLRMIGLEREGVVFHSFRHTFVSRLEEAGVDTARIGRIVGHKINGITAGTYGGKLFTPSKRLECFKDLDFGVDLTHLMGR